MPPTIVRVDNSSADDDAIILLGQKVLLKIFEKPHSKLLLDDVYVQKFVTFPNLCRESLQQKLSHFFDTDSRFIDECINETKIRHTMNDVTNLVEYKIESSKHLEELSNNENLEEFIKELGKKEDKDSREKYHQILYIKEQFEDTIRDMHKISRRKKSWLSNLNGETFSAGKDLEKELGFNILTSHTYVFCSDCGTLIPLEEYEPKKKCTRCEKEIERKDAEYIEVFIANDKVRDVWKSGLWFEAYISGLLRKMGWQTWTDIYVMGSSGARHEIDVLAIKDSSVIVSECKRGTVKRTDIFNFNAKAEDIRAHLSILATINALPEPETREIVRKNPSIIRLENMCKQEENEIIADLGLRLAIKT